MVFHILSLPMNYHMENKQQEERFIRGQSVRVSEDLA